MQFYGLVNILTLFFSKLDTHKDMYHITKDVGRMQYYEIEQ